MAQALRDNLFKRKAQARKRSAPTDAKPLDDAQKTDEA